MTARLHLYRHHHHHHRRRRRRRHVIVLSLQRKVGFIYCLYYEDRKVRARVTPGGEARPMAAATTKAK